MDFFGHTIAYVILNFIGGILRWIYGSVWRTIFKKQKFTFWEYINGPKKSSDYYDKMGHNQNNVFIAFAFFFIVALILNKCS